MDERPSSPSNSETIQPSAEETPYQPIPPYRAPRARSRLSNWMWVLLGVAMVTTYSLIMCVIGMVAIHDGLQDREVRLAQAAVHYDRGVAYMEQENYAQAAVEFQKAVEVAPGYRDSRALLEKSREQAKRLTDAVTLLQKGQEHYNQGQWELAIHYLEQVRTLNPDYEREKVENLLFFAYYNKGLQLVAVDQIAEALTQFDLALAIRPGHPDVVQQRTLAQRYLEGREREAIGDWPAAIRSYQAVQQVNVRYRDVAQRIYNVRVQYGDQLAGAGSWCAAHEQYDLAAQMGIAGAATAKRDVAWAQCQQAQTPSPTRRIESTSVPRTPGRTTKPGTYKGRLASTYDVPGSIQIRGYVQDRQGQGVAGTAVVITIFDFQETHGTDANGYFSFDGIVSPYTATLTLRDLPSQPLSIALQFGRGFVIRFEEE